ncbi:hypothetical protein [Jatrophihabitans lederbergiae]|uniref:Uncharacterized protein n=1 Tax=Jatrophihabitans lederbergiae TaxID=3075547 RepID=A0ABU2JBP0_9ACTN|nr:hypothetical protein [Jatrophihabitans sp. DSM 44399]MDT0262410.1 hypothetical protein [Jatrophihabitans sp. DSM 44399]
MSRRLGHVRLRPVHRRWPGAFRGRQAGGALQRARAELDRIEREDELEIGAALGNVD